MQLRCDMLQASADRGQREGQICKKEHQEGPQCFNLLDMGFSN